VTAFTCTYDCECPADWRNAAAAARQAEVAEQAAGTGSPCIDEANGSVAPGIDMDGNPRVDGPDNSITDVGPRSADMGAYEYEPSLKRLSAPLPRRSPVCGLQRFSVGATGFEPVTSSV